MPFPIINGENRIICKEANKSTSNIVSSAKSEPLPRKKTVKTTKIITTSNYDLVENDDFISENNDKYTDEKEDTEDSEESSLDNREKIKKNRYCLAATSAPAILFHSQVKDAKIAQ